MYVRLTNDQTDPVREVEMTDKHEANKSRVKQKPGVVKGVTTAYL